MTSKSDEGYNGWTNWETWNSYNWLTSYEDVNKEAEWLGRRYIKGSNYGLDQFKEFVEEYFKSGTVKDEIDLNKVDWDELYAAFKSEDEEDEDKEEADDDGGDYEWPLIR